MIDDNATSATYPGEPGESRRHWPAPILGRRTSVPETTAPNLSADELAYRARLRAELAFKK
jgi:hypothetical protein